MYNVHVHVASTVTWCKYVLAIFTQFAKFNTLYVQYMYMYIALR